MRTIDGTRRSAPTIWGAPPRILAVTAPYYQEVVNGLLEGAAEIIDEAGCTQETIEVAGALELAGAVRLAQVRPGEFDAFIVLGCVIKGDTDHYEFVCREAMAGLTQVVQAYALCLGNGLLTVNDLAQAVARSGPDGRNKGAEAAIAALMQVSAARWLAER